jgi:hypothetical protein
MFCILYFRQPPRITRTKVGSTRQRVNKSTLKKRQVSNQAIQQSTKQRKDGKTRENFLKRVKMLRTRGMHYDANYCSKLVMYANENEAYR